MTREYSRWILSDRAWLTEEGVIAHVQSTRMWVGEPRVIEAGTRCWHQIVFFRRRGADPIELESWSGLHIIPTAEPCWGPFNKKPFPRIIKEVVLTTLQIQKVTGEWEQAPRKKGYVQRECKPKVKSREVWVELGRDSRLPQREMSDWAVEAIHVTRFVDAKGNEWEIPKTKMNLCVKGYPEPYTVGPVSFEFLHHNRARHLYVDSLNNTTGKLCFLVRLKKGKENAIA